MYNNTRVDDVVDTYYVALSGRCKVPFSFTETFRIKPKVLEFNASLPTLFFLRSIEIQSFGIRHFIKFNSSNNYTD